MSFISLNVLVLGCLKHIWFRRETDGIEYKNPLTRQPRLVVLPKEENPNELKCADDFCLEEGKKGI